MARLVAAGLAALLRLGLLQFFLSFDELLLHLPDLLLQRGDLLATVYFFSM